MKKIGLVNIGDSPIAGIDIEKQQLLAGYQLEETGALDELTPQQLQEVAYDGVGDLLTVERNDGSFVKLKKEKIHGFIDKAIEQARMLGCEVFYLHCTGFFPEIAETKDIIKPGRLLEAVALGYGPDTKMAILTPTKEHVKQVQKKWSHIPCEKTILPVHPFLYREAVEEIGEGWKQFDVILLDCTSYGIEFQQYLEQFTDSKIHNAIVMALEACKAQVM